MRLSVRPCTRWGIFSSVARTVVAPEGRPLIQAVAMPCLRRRTRPMPSRMEKVLDSVPSAAMCTVPSVRMPSTSMAKSLMADQREAGRAEGMGSSADPVGDVCDGGVAGGAIGVLELGGEGHGHVERGDAQGRGLEVEEVFLGQTGDELGTEAVGASALVDDDEAVGALQRGADGVEIERGERAQVEDIEGLFVFPGEVVAGLDGEVDHLAVGDDGGEVAAAQVAGLPDVAVGGIPGDGGFAAAVETLVFEEEHGVVVLVGGEQGVEG